MTVSGILSAIIITFLTSKVLQIRQERLAHIPELKNLTQKVHKFRNIINKLLHSHMWPDGLWIYIDKNYKDLTYFDIRAVTFVDSKITEQASKYIQDHKYGDTGNLYLELKSFIFDHPFDNTLYTEFEVPVYYSNEVVEKWVEYECGNGLWYFFEYKRGLYEKALRVDTVYDGDQKEIKEICLRIDKERYMDLDFGPELLSKLGNQFYQEIIPKLYRIQIYLDKGLPRIVKYLFILLGILIVFGVALPLLIKLFSLNSVFDVISTSMILSLCFYLISSFYQSMHNEIKLY